VRIIIEYPENILHLKDRIHLRGLPFPSTSNLLESGGGTDIRQVEKSVCFLAYLTNPIASIDEPDYDFVTLAVGAQP
jgi:hypothetical protein